MDRTPPFARRDCRCLCTAKADTANPEVADVLGRRSWRLSIMPVAAMTPGSPQRLNDDGTSCALLFAMPSFPLPQTPLSFSATNISRQFPYLSLHFPSGSQQVNMRRIPILHRGTSFNWRFATPGSATPAHISDARPFADDFPE